MISWGQLCSWSYMVMKCLVIVDDLDSVFSSYIKWFLELRLLNPLKMLLYGVSFNFYFFCTCTFRIFFFLFFTLRQSNMSSNTTQFLIGVGLFSDLIAYFFTNFFLFSRLIAYVFFFFHIAYVFKFIYFVGTINLYKINPYNLQNFVYSPILIAHN